jgi:hypothetical protein
LGVLNQADHRLQANVQMIARLWLNNMRFEATRATESRWRRLGEINGRRTIKVAAREFVEACSAVEKECEVLYEKE